MQSSLYKLSGSTVLFYLFLNSKVVFAFIKMLCQNKLNPRKNVTDIYRSSIYMYISIFYSYICLYVGDDPVWGRDPFCVLTWNLNVFGSGLFLSFVILHFHKLVVLFQSVVFWNIVTNTLITSLTRFCLSSFIKPCL